MSTAAKVTITQQPVSPLTTYLHCDEGYEGEDMSSGEADQILLHGQERHEELGSEMNSVVSGQGVRGEEKRGPSGFLAERAPALRAESGRSGRVGAERRLGQGVGCRIGRGRAV